MRQRILTVVTTIIFLNSITAISHAQSSRLIRKTDFNKSSIESYGPIVKGEFMTSIIDDRGQKSTHSGVELYFCKLEESITAYEKSQYPALNENENPFTSIRNSSESRWSLNYQRNSQLLVSRGYESLLIEMKKKCGKTKLKPFPSFEIPVASNDNSVMYSLLDSINIQNHIVRGWFKLKFIIVTPATDPNGNPMIVDGEQLTNFEFDKSKGFSLSEYQFDCHKGQQRLNRTIEYETNGNPKKEIDFSKEAKLFQDPIPKSFGEGLQKFACSLRS